MIAQTNGAKLLSQEYHYQFQKYTVSNGLPSTQVYQIIQASNGYIWFGTDRGVVCYNGYEFTVYTSNNGLASNVIFYIAEGPDKSIWAYGMNRTLSYFSDGYWQPFDHNENFQKYAHPNSIPLSLSVDENNITVYLNSSINRYYKIQISKNGEVEVFKDEESYKIIIEDTKNGPAITGLDYANKFKNKHIKLQLEIRDSLKQKTMPFELESVANKVLRIVKHDENYLFTVHHTLFEYNSQHQLKVVQNFKTRILELANFSEDEVMVGTEDGLWILNSKDLKVKRHELSRHHVSSIVQDASGGLWAGTLFNGLYYRAPNAADVLVLEDPSAVLHVEGSDKSVCFVTQDKKFYRDNGKEIEKVTQISKFNSSRMLYHLGDDVFLWTYGGEKRNELIDFKNNVREYIYSLEDTPLKNFDDVQKVEDGYWVYYKNKVGKYDFDLNCIAQELYVSSDLQFQGISLSPEGNCLLGTKKGCFELINKQLHPYKKENAFFNSSITDILRTTNGYQVFASESFGLYFIKDSVEFQISSKNGLVSDHIHKMCWFDNRLFALSNKGLSVIDTNLKIQNLTSKNGLSSSTIKDVFFRNDTLWIANNIGLDRYVFNSLERSSVPIYIENILLDDNKVPIQPFIKMSPGQRSLSIEFSVLSYAHLGNFRYKYKLESFDQQWHFTSDRKITYPYISPGNFELKFSYQNLQGNWIDPIVFFKLQKLKPYWQRWWFILILVVGVFVILSLILWGRVKLIKKKATDKYNLLELERQALQSQMNPHFVFNSLSSIQSLILQKKTDEAVDYLVKFGHLTRTALNHSKSKSVPLESELKLLKNYIELECLRFQKSFEWQIKSEIDGNVKIPPTIIQPFVENAIKHGLLPKKSGKKKLFIQIEKYEQDLIKCIVEDNGVGREASKNKSDHGSESMGVRLIEERLKLLTNNKMQLISFIDLKTEGKAVGTRVEILIPIVP